MLNNTLVYPVGDRPKASSVHDQVQIALAIADETLLRSLLVDSMPAIVPPHQIGTITSEIGVSVEAQAVADGILQFDWISCVLANPQRQVEHTDAADTASKSRYPGNWDYTKDYAKFTQCESEMRMLGHNISWAQALAILTHAGFSHREAHDILYLPCAGWYKSWWYALDEYGEFTIPFYRLIRTRRFADGTFTLQYKDYFAQDKPSCFSSIKQKVLVHIATDQSSFSQTLHQVNYLRKQLSIERAILIGDQISEFEARGFISQGISIYTAHDLIWSTQSDCTLCANRNCPMNGLTDSPVTTCKRFVLEDWSD
jgi:hypothetical protein